MKLGVCYYPEHWPEERWATDARLMREAGLQIVRIGEFAWAQMEPEDGRFDWGWLDRAVAALARRGPADRDGHAYGRAARLDGAALSRRPPGGRAGPHAALRLAAARLRQQPRLLPA